MNKEYKGISVTSGTGTGKIKIIDCSCPEFKVREIEDNDRELGRFVRALKAFCDDTRKQMAYIEENIGHQESQILEAHIRMTHDLALQTELISKISNGMCAEQATCEICDAYIKRFLDADSDFVRQLYLDVLDVEVCILNHLLDREEVAVENFSEDTIVVAYQLTPSIVARLDRVHTKGIAVEMGSANSHGAKLAKSMGIPSIASVRKVDRIVKEGEIATVDADKGVFIINN